MLGHQSDHHHCQRTGSAGYHAGATAPQRGHQAHHKRRVQPHQRMDTGDEGKRHRLGDQGQGHGETGKDVVFKIGGAVLSDQVEHG